MADLPIVSSADTIVAVSIPGLDTAPWGYCPTVAGTDAEHLSLEEVNANAGALSKLGLGLGGGWGSLKIKENTQLIYPYVERVTYGGEVGPVSTERHGWNLQASAKDGTYTGASAKLTLTSTFISTSGFILPIDATLAAALSYKSQYLTDMKTYYVPTGSVQQNKVFTYGSGTTNGLLNVSEADDTTPPASILGLSAIYGSGEPLNGWSYKVGLTWPVFLAGLSVGSNLYVSATGDITTSVSAAGPVGKVVYSSGSATLMSLMTVQF
jgi:hypothetical protein